MTRLFRPIARASMLALLGLSGAVDVQAGGWWPYSPQLRVATPICRRHACGADQSVPCKRGVAILSPVESPDCYNPPVGGKPRVVPYYVDYCTHWPHGPRVCVPGNGIGYFSRPMPFAQPINADVVSDNPTAYGMYSGADKDEQMLLHLGGTSSPEPSFDGSNTTPDMIDLIQSTRCNARWLPMSAAAIPVEAPAAEDNNPPAPPEPQDNPPQAP